MIETGNKEFLLKLMSKTIDSHTELEGRSSHYIEGIKHVRNLFDRHFESEIVQDELLEFCVSIICSIQPEEPQDNHHLSDLEQGILAAAYFLYTAMHPIEYQVRNN